MLNPKKKLFAKEYLIDHNATQAAIRAGYSPKTAYSQGQRLLKSVEVIAIVSQELKAREERTEITADYVLINLQEAVERFKIENPGAAIKALELLGKNLKLFTDKLDINITLSSAWERASYEEKVELIEKLKAERG